MRLLGLPSGGRTSLTCRSLLLALGALSLLPLGAAPGASTASPLALTLPLGLASATAPWIGTQPVAATAIDGRTQACFTVNAYYDGLHYQWQRKDATHDWADIAEATLYYCWTPVVSLADQGAQYRVVVSNALGSVTSNPATLTVEYLSITQQPASQVASPGCTATFSVGVSATPAPTYQWERRAPGSTRWVAISGATGSSCTTPALAPGDSGAAYRVVMRNRAGVFTSDAAALEVRKSQPLTIVQQPTSTTGSAPFGSAYFTVLAVGDPAPTYQWQFREPYENATWLDTWPGQSPTLELMGVYPFLGTYKYRVKITNGLDTLYSDEVSVRVYTLDFFPDPQSVTTDAGSTATFTAGVQGDPEPVTQWQRSTDGGGTWVPIEGATGLTYTTPVLGSEDNGNQYRLAASSAWGGRGSNPAQLTVRGREAATLDFQFEGLPTDVAPVVWISGNETGPQQVNGAGPVQLYQGVWSIAPCAIWGTGPHQGKVFQASPAQVLHLGPGSQICTVRYVEAQSKTLQIPRAGRPGQFVAMDFVWISPGQFAMGCEQDPGPTWQTTPIHQVNLQRGFWMSKTDVSRDQFHAVMDDASAPPVEQPDTSMVGFTADQVKTFLDRLGAQAGLPEGCGSYRLPSEAEWEYAYRAGSVTKAFFGNDPDLEPCFSGVDPSLPGRQRVGMGAPNPWGLYDMIGNANELCQDVWHSNFQGAPTDGSAWTSGAGPYVVGMNANCAAVSRGAHDASLGSSGIGLRVVLQ